MEIKERIFETTDAEGIRHDLSALTSIPVIINGKDNQITLQHVFRKFDLEEADGEIFGVSLLSYFTAKDGKLVDAEGNTVEFQLPDGKPLLITDNTQEPFIYDEAEVDLEYIKAFSELIGIKKPDELFADLLSETEKEYFTTERGKKEAEQSTIASQKKAEEDALLEQKKQKEEEDRIANEKKEIIAKIDPAYLVDERKHKQLQKFYGDINFKEYIIGNTHLFYGKDWETYVEDPFMLIRRTDKYLEEVEVFVDDIVENDKTVELSFMDGEERKTVILDIATDTISIAVPEPQ